MRVAPLTLILATAASLQVSGAAASSASNSFARINFQLDTLIAEGDNAEEQLAGRARLTKQSDGHIPPFFASHDTGAEAIDVTTTIEAMSDDVDTLLLEGKRLEQQHSRLVQLTRQSETNIPPFIATQAPSSSPPGEPPKAPTPPKEPDVEVPAAVFASTSSGVGGEQASDDPIVTAETDTEIKPPVSIGEMYEGESAFLQLSLLRIPTEYVTVTLTQLETDKLQFVDNDGAGVETVVTFPAGSESVKAAKMEAPKSPDIRNHSAEITVSTSSFDSSYAGLSQRCTVSILDTDTAGVILRPTNVTVQQGDDVPVPFNLQSRPSADVQVSMKLNNKQEEDVLMGTSLTLQLSDVLEVPAINVQPQEFNASNELVLRAREVMEYIGSQSYELVLNTSSEDEKFDNLISSGTFTLNVDPKEMLQLEVETAGDVSSFSTSRLSLQANYRPDVDITFNLTYEPSFDVEYQVPKEITRSLRFEPNPPQLRTSEFPRSRIQIATRPFPQLLEDLEYQLQLEGRSPENESAFYKAMAQNLSAFVVREQRALFKPEPELKLNVESIEGNIASNTSERNSLRYLFEDAVMTLSMSLPTPPVENVSVLIEADELRASTEEEDETMREDAVQIECTPQQHDPCGSFDVSVASNSSLLQTDGYSEAMLGMTTKSSSEPFYGDLSGNFTLSVIGNTGSRSKAAEIEEGNVAVSIGSAADVSITGLSSAIDQEATNSRKLMQTEVSGNVSFAREPLPSRLDQTSNELPSSDLYDVRSEFLQVSVELPNGEIDTSATMNISLALLDEAIPGTRIAKVPLNGENDAPYAPVTPDMHVFRDENNTLKGSVIIEESVDGIEGTFTVVFVKPRIRGVFGLQEREILYDENTLKPESIALEDLDFDHTAARVQQMNVSLINAQEGDELVQMLNPNCSLSENSPVQLRSHNADDGHTFIEMRPSEGEAVEVQDFLPVLCNLGFRGAAQTAGQKRKLAMRLVEGNGTIVDIGGDFNRTLSVKPFNTPPSVAVSTTSKLEVEEGGEWKSIDPEMQLNDTEGTILYATIKLSFPECDNDDAIPDTAYFPRLNVSNTGSKISVARLGSQEIMLNGPASAQAFETALREVKISQQGPVVACTAVIVNISVVDDGDWLGDTTLTQSKADTTIRNVHVKQKNDPPTVETQAKQDVQRYFDTPTSLIGQLQASDPDDDASELTFERDTIESGSELGSLTVYANGTYKFEPYQYRFGNVRFTYVVEDPGGAQTSGEQEISVLESSIAKPVMCTPSTINVSVACNREEESCENVTDKLPASNPKEQRPCDNLGGIDRFYLLTPPSNISEGRLELHDKDEDENRLSSTTGSFTFIPYPNGETTSILKLKFQAMIRDEERNLTLPSDPGYLTLQINRKSTQDPGMSPSAPPAPPPLVPPPSSPENTVESDDGGSSSLASRLKPHWISAATSHIILLLISLFYFL